MSCPTEVWLMNNSIFIVLYLHFWSLIRETKSFRHRNFMCFVCTLKLIFLVSQLNNWFQYNELNVIIYESRVHKMDSSTRCLKSQCTAIHTKNDFQNSVLQVKKSGSGKKLYWKKKKKGGTNVFSEIIIRQNTKEEAVT